MPYYRITDKAGQWVAGKRVRVGDVLELTERQAEHEFRLGTITPAGASQAAQTQPATTAKAKAQTPAQAATVVAGEAV